MSSKPNQQKLGQLQIASLLLATLIGCGGGGSDWDSTNLGSVVNAEYKEEALECNGPTSLELQDPELGLDISVSRMSPCAEAHAPEVDDVNELPERMLLADYELNVTKGTAAADVSLGMRDFSSYSTSATIVLGIDLHAVPAEQRSEETVLARIYDLDDDTVYDVAGALSENTLTISVPGVPNRFYIAAIYNPSMRSVGSMTVVSGNRWPAHRWCVLYDSQNPALVLSAAALYNSNEPSSEQISATAQRLLVSELEQAQVQAEEAGYQAPANRVVAGSQAPCAALGVEPRYLANFELINRQLLAPAGVVFLSMPAYTLGVFNIKSRLLSAEAAGIKSAANFGKAFPTAVNNQITDSVSQINTKVLGDAPAIAMGNLYVATSQALANAAHNATSNQQQSSVTTQAATTMGVSTLYSIDTASTGAATSGIFRAAKLGADVPAVSTALEEDEFRLDDWLLTERSSRANQDFFAYVARRYAGGSLTYVTSMMEHVFETVSQAADSAQTPQRRAGLLFSPDLVIVRGAIDHYFRSTFSVGLAQAYVDFVVNRAVLHNTASMLRSDDPIDRFSAELFSFDPDSSERSSLVRISPDDAETKGTFVNIAPFASRAIVISADALTALGAADVELTSSRGAVGDMIQGAYCQAGSCNPLSADFTVPVSGGEAVVLIANVAMEGSADVSFRITSADD